MTYYVYALCDPETELPFYIGKGKWINKRHMDHLRETEKKTSNRYKFYKIQSIRNRGLEPKVWIIKTDFDSENDAYDFEELQIQKYGLHTDGGILTNVIKDGRPPNHTGRKRSKDWCERHGNYWRGKSKTEDQKRKISDTLKGNIPWNKDITGVVTQSQESNQARSMALKAHWAKKRLQNEK